MPASLDEIKEGDLVELKSGSIQMIVGHIKKKNGSFTSGTFATCYWFSDVSAEIKTLEIHTIALKKVN